MEYKGSYFRVSKQAEDFTVKSVNFGRLSKQRCCGTLQEDVSQWTWTCFMLSKLFGCCKQLVKMGLLFMQAM